MKPRVLVLPIAAAIIVGLCLWKSLQPATERPLSVNRPSVQPAPAFDLYDQQSKLVKFERYLGRHKILLAFVDAAKEQPDSRLLDQLRTFHEALERQGYVVVAVTGCLPSQNRQGVETPFPLLTDLNLRVAGSQYMTYRQWGLFDARTRQPRVGIFVIDRSGTVDWMGDAPQPAERPEEVIRTLSSAS